MAKPRLQSLGHDVPPSPPPPSPSPRLLRDADGGWRCRSLCASLCGFAPLRFMPIPHEQLGSLLYSSKPSASLLSSLSPPFEFHSEDRHTGWSQHTLTRTTGARRFRYFRCMYTIHKSFQLQERAHRSQIYLVNIQPTARTTSIEARGVSNFFPKQKTRSPISE